MTDREKYLKKYLQYIKNTGRVPLGADMFDDDWDPIGATVRQELDTKGYITQVGGIFLSETGKRLLEDDT